MKTKSLVVLCNERDNIEISWCSNCDTHTPSVSRFLIVLRSMGDRIILRYVGNCLVFTGKRKGHASSCASSSSSKVLQAVSSRANFLLRSFLAGGVAELAAQAWVDEGGLWEEEEQVGAEDVVVVGVVVEMALAEALVELEEVTVEVLSMS